MTFWTPTQSQTHKHYEALNSESHLYIWNRDNEIKRGKIVLNGKSSYKDIQRLMVFFHSLQQPRDLE